MSEQETSPKLGKRSAWFENNQKKFNNGLGGSVIVLFAVVVVVLVTAKNDTITMITSTSTSAPPAKLPYDESKLSDEEKSRINCFLEEQSKLEKLTKYQCELRGCIYDPSPYEKVPNCYFDRRKTGYKLASTIENANEISYYLNRNTDVNAPFGFGINRVKVSVEYLGKNVINVKLSDGDNERYEVPFGLNKPVKTGADQSLAQFVSEVDADSKLFSFKILRKSDNKALFDTKNGALILSDQFLQISTNLPSKNIYGFGENNHESLKHKLDFMSWGIFAHDWSPGWSDNSNNYGHQPAYYVIEESGKSHAVLLYSSNAMEYLFTPSPSLTLRTIGGVLDLYFVVDETPESVTQNYHNLIGLPLLPPYWSMGFQLSRWGYRNLSDLKAAVDRTRNIQLPHDVQYMDIDYMNGYRIFTVDQKNFKGLSDYAKEIKANGLHVVLIIDPGVVVEGDNQPYRRGLTKDVFLKWSKNNEPYDRDAFNSQDLMGWCWPNGKISYPDFFNNETHSWWADEINRFSNDQENGCYLDGTWIDMNEPASFATNDLKPHNWLYDEKDEAHPYFTLKCPTNRWEDPPYRTKNTFHFDNEKENKKARLSTVTICMSAEHRMGDKRFLHYNVHSLYGHTNAIATFNGLKNIRPGIRPFSLTRSNFVGTGQYAVHWLGDNDSTWKHMKMSLIGIMEYNFFGIPMVGADICGFWMDVVNAEMCTRWLQVGAFYPFSRSHNSNNLVNKDPGSFNDKTLEESTRNAYRLRYTILPYFYTLFYRSHTKGGTVARPLFYEFPTDTVTYDIDEQFLLGQSFLVSPVLYQGRTQVNAYLPPASRWFDFRTGKEVTTKGWITLDAPLNYINLHLRGGFILPTQDPLNQLNTKGARTNPMGMVVALDQNKQATGELFWDDGETFKFEQEDKYYHASFNFDQNKLAIKVLKNTIDQQATGIQNLKFDSIKVYGLDKKPDSITGSDGNRLEFDYNPDSNSVIIKNAGINLGSDFTVQIN